MSAPFTLDKNEGLKILKVLGWTIGSAVVAALVALVAHLNVASPYIWLIPVVNTILVAVQQFIKDNRQEF